MRFILNPPSFLSSFLSPSLPSLLLQISTVVQREQHQQEQISARTDFFRLRKMHRMQPVPVGRRNGGKGGGQGAELLRSTVKIGGARVFSKGFVSFRFVW